MTIKLFIPAAPVTKGSTKLKYSYAKRRMIVAPDNGAKQASFINTSMPYINQAMAGKEKLTGAVSILARFYIPRGKCVTRRLPCVKPDLDKYLRMIFDVLSGHIWIDDGQVVKVESTKDYASGGQVAGVELVVSEVEA